MECRQCGLVLGPFDSKCPRCGQVPGAETAAAVGRATAPPAGAAGRTVSYVAAPARRRVGAALVALLVGIPLAILAGLRIGPGSGMHLVQSRPAVGGGSVVQAPAVSADQIGQRLVSAGAVTGGEVEVSLAWNSLTDLDLEVREPGGEVIWAKHPLSKSGGTQDVDANPTLVTSEGHRRADAGQNPGPENVEPLPEGFVDFLEPLNSLPKETMDLLKSLDPEGKAFPKFSRTPVEHIYFAQAPRGTYTVYAHCYSWREKDANPLPYTVQVRSQGKAFHEVSGALGPANYITDNTAPSAVCQFVMR